MAAQEPELGVTSESLAREYLEKEAQARARQEPWALINVQGDDSQPQWAIYGFAYDPADPALRLTGTMGKSVLGNQTLPEMIEQLPKSPARPVAGINGDFFEIRRELPYVGAVEGMTVVEGELMTTPRGWTFWTDRDGKAGITRVTSQARVTWPDGTSQPIAINGATSDSKSQVGNSAAVLYTPAFSQSTLTPAGGREWVLQPLDPKSLPIRPGAEFQARIVQEQTGGNSKIPRDGLVLSLSRELSEKAPALSQGDVITIGLTTRPDMSHVQTCIGGAPVLALEGKGFDNTNNQSRAPRTAVGVRPDGTAVFIVVDGRRTGHSIGMTHKELAQWMLMIGCSSALNLDGGGSSTLWHQGKVANRPSDGSPRRIGNAIVMTRQIPTPKHAHEDESMAPSK
jgi:hypothetical protein